MNIEEFIIHNESTNRLSVFSGMNIGIHGFTQARQTTPLHRLLLIPFIGKLNGYTINRRQWNNDNKPTDHSEE